MKIKLPSLLHRNKPPLKLVVIVEQVAIGVQSVQPPSTRASFNDVAVGENGNCALVNDIVDKSTYKNATSIFDTTDYSGW